MPDNSGSGQSKGKTHSACTLKTPHPNSPSPTELVMLTSNLGPVENEVRTFLEQRALLAIDNNYTAETLANILFNTALKNKLPDITFSIIKAVGFLIIHKLNINISTEITSTIFKQLPTHNQSITNKLKYKSDFIKATTTEQSKLMLQLSNLIKTLNSTITNLNSTNQLITAITKDTQLLSHSIRETNL